MSKPSKFSYPPLPSDTAAIRLLTIHPGEGRIEAILETSTFASKPRYLALSYTWNHPFPESRLKKKSRFSPLYPYEIYIDGTPIPVHANLLSCLFCLRSPVYPLKIWIDAICINQDDPAERNEQVAIMSFIYSRAQLVVAWLGSLIDVISTNRETDANRLSSYISDDASLPRLSALRCEPDDPKLASSSYWTRLWIAQEVCLANTVVFTCGDSVWTFEEIKGWTDTISAKTGLEAPPGFRSMLRLLHARLSRFSDGMKLENLIEHFSEHNCSEPRDRIFALVGLANDVRPLAFHAGARAEEDALEMHIKTLDFRQEHLPEPERGVGRILVDYSRGFYDIWRDVVKFIYFRARPVEWRWSSSVVKTHALPAATVQKLERYVSVVRAAGVVQGLFHRRVQDELASRGTPLVRRQNPVIRAIGYVAGQIRQIGPQYDSLVASPQAADDWFECLENAYHSPLHLQKLRTMNSQYMAKIIAYGRDELDLVADINKPHVLAWRLAGTPRHLEKPLRPSERIRAEWYSEKRENSSPISHREPRICVGTNHLIALVPPGAEEGDIVVRFWNCGAALVMRPLRQEPMEGDEKNMMPCAFGLIGRADVAEVVDRSPQLGDRHAEATLFRTSFPASIDIGTLGPVYVEMDFPTLQIITASIST
ncbi:heterokaryon incompatibility protein-domain-containing protein [Echria macrotheca]|uniref:Heterokaryon incompatibility protein-domain-containing protein n=1 Tax=Echria macrotheca TaxID=438768 RepID=A0AAJ0F7Q5_9PEZI|nr:heterokaryon incompatibility protein-domain-containing protein [Echria macrotheca]